MARRAGVLVTVGCVLLQACGSTPSREGGPTISLKLSRCSFSGSLQATAAGVQPRVLSTGFCGGGAFDAGAAGAGLDLVLDVGNDESVTVTINAVTTNQTLQIDAPPPTLNDQSLFLGAAVPAGAVWVRHRAPPAGPNKKPTFAPMRGSVTVGGIGLAPADCSPEVCPNGTVSLELTFDHVEWTSPSGVIDYTGRFSVAAETGDYTTCSACPSGFRCNQATPTFGYLDTSCGPMNATGAELGRACGSPSMCKSNYCESFTGQCTLFCVADDECGSGTSCESSHFNSLWNECIRSCQRNADCAVLPSASTCVAHASANGKKIVGGCGGARGTTTFGKVPTKVNGCDTELTDGSFRDICTRLCVTDADCAPPLPSCKSSVIATTLTTSDSATVMICQ